ncbi:hypothetical protein SLEP1_g59340 [Rubroshorea leprosula]|uniref:Uncharacterized protein n=1 Tax=Rubroshorea leprosula TaxID=152421 RepID=A0AAV5MTA1_9ROSI|nr:hypothetical protein SLEP1_g59340 [Rubroshorea leprosula]
MGVDCQVIYTNSSCDVLHLLMTTNQSFKHLGTWLRVLTLQLLIRF